MLFRCYTTNIIIYQTSEHSLAYLNHVLHSPFYIPCLHPLHRLCRLRLYDITIHAIMKSQNITVTIATFVPAIHLSRLYYSHNLSPTRKHQVEIQGQHLISVVIIVKNKLTMIPVTPQMPSTSKLIFNDFKSQLYITVTTKQ
jgi:hypothetical protein